MSYPRTRRIALKVAIQSYKESHPCADCGGYFPAVAMDFDHLNNKTKSISRLMRDKYGLARIVEEMKKCELVCSNCHRIRTNRRNPHT